MVDFSLWLEKQCSDISYRTVWWLHNHFWRY